MPSGESLQLQSPGVDDPRTSVVPGAFPRPPSAASTFPTIATSTVASPPGRPGLGLSGDLASLGRVPPREVAPAKVTWRF